MIVINVARFQLDDVSVCCKLSVGQCRDVSGSDGYLVSFCLRRQHVVSLDLHADNSDATN